MKMAEGAKLQMCYLLQHLVDIQLRHRVEAIIHFSYDYIADLQTVRFHLIYSIRIIFMYVIGVVSVFWVDCI